MSELFGGLIAPGVGGRLALERELRRRRDAWDKPGFHYRGAGDLLLQHGTYWPGRELPEQWRHLAGADSLCFRNSLEAVAASNGELRYCEGLFTSGYGHYTNHAWCIDADGGLCEMTMPTWRADYLVQLPNGGRAKPMPVAQWSYQGVVLHPDYVNTYRALIGGEDSCFDRDPSEPIIAARLGRSAEHFAEWRDDWPLLRYPYDPNRRTL